MSNAPLILLSHSMLAPVEFALTAAGYRVARGWELEEGQRPRSAPLFMRESLSSPRTF